MRSLSKTDLVCLATFSTKLSLPSHAQPSTGDVHSITNFCRRFLVPNYWYSQTIKCQPGWTPLLLYLLRNQIQLKKILLPSGGFVEHANFYRESWQIGHDQNAFINWPRGWCVSWKQETAIFVRTAIYRLNLPSKVDRHQASNQAWIRPRLWLYSRETSYKVLYSYGKYARLSYRFFINQDCTRTKLINMPTRVLKWSALIKY